MSEFDNIKRTRIQSASLINPNEGVTKSFFDVAADFQNMSAGFAQEAKQEAGDAGRLAGQNSVSINPDGTISRSAVPDAGKFFSKEYMAAQRTAAKGALETSIKARTQEFLVEHQNDPNALKKFDQFKTSYIDSLVGNLHKDIQGQVALVADQVVRGTINSINDADVRRAHENGMLTFENNLTSDLNNLAELRRAGANQKANELEQKIYGDMTDASQTWLTTSGLEAINKQILVANESGNVVNATEGMSFENAQAYLNAYRNKPIDGLGPAEKAKIVQEAEAKISRAIASRNFAESEEARAAEGPLLDAKRSIVEATRNLPHAAQLTPSEVDRIYQSNGLHRMMHIPSVERQYLQDIGASVNQQKAAYADKIAAKVGWDIVSIKEGKTTYGTVLMSPHADDFSSGDFLNLWKAEQVRLSGLEELDLADLANSTEKKISLFQFTPQHIDWYSKNGSESHQKWFRKNASSLLSKIETAYKSPAFKAYQVENFFMLNNRMPSKLPAGYDSEMEKRLFSGGSFNPLDQNHLEIATKEMFQKKRIPQWMSDGLFNNYNALFLHNQDAAAKFIDLVGLMKDPENASLHKGLPQIFHDSQSVYNLAGLVSLPPDRYDRAINNFFSERGDQKQTTEEIYKRYTQGGSNSFMSELSEAVSASAKATQMIDSFVGGAGPFRWLFGANGREMLEGAGIVPSSLSNIFSSPDFTANNQEAIDEIEGIAAAYAIAGDSNPWQKAMETFAGRGGGFTIRNGELVLSSHSYEKALENAGIEDSPMKYARYALLDHMDKVKEAVAREGGGDFGKDWSWSRLLGSEAEFIDFSEFSFGDTFGLWEGGDLGEDIESQTKSFNRFEEAYNEGRIEITSAHIGANAFYVTLNLGKRDGRGNEVKVTLPNLLRIGPDSHQMVSSEIVKEQYGRGAVRRFMSHPEMQVQKIATGRYDKEDADLQAFQAKQWRIQMGIAIEENKGLVE